MAKHRVGGSVQWFESILVNLVDTAEGESVLTTLKKVTTTGHLHDVRGCRRSGDNPERTTRTLFPFDVLITSQYKAKHIRGSVV